MNHDGACMAFDKQGNFVINCRFAMLNQGYPPMLSYPNFFLIEMCLSTGPTRLIPLSPKGLPSSWWVTKGFGDVGNMLRVPNINAFASMLHATLEALKGVLS